MVVYEWVLEWTDEYGEIVDVEYRKDLGDLIPIMRPDDVPPSCNPQLALMRDKCCDGSGSIEERDYAYVNNWQLPEMIGRFKTPKKYHELINKFKTEVGSDWKSVDKHIQDEFGGNITKAAKYYNKDRTNFKRAVFGKDLYAIRVGGQWQIWGMVMAAEDLQAEGKNDASK